MTTEDGRGGANRRVRDLERLVDGLQKAYLRASETIAAMHAAALGECRQPVKDIVEEVYDAREAAREEIDHLATLLAEVSAERARIAREQTAYQNRAERRIRQLVIALMEADVSVPLDPEEDAC